MQFLLRGDQIVVGQQGRGMAPTRVGEKKKDTKYLFQMNVLCVTYKPLAAVTIQLIMAVSISFLMHAMHIIITAYITVYPAQKPTQEQNTGFWGQ